MAKYFSAFIHIYNIYGMDPSQLLDVVVKQASKLYLETQRQAFPLCCSYTCINSLAAPVRDTYLCDFCHGDIFPARSFHPGDIFCGVFIL